MLLQEKEEQGKILNQYLGTICLNVPCAQIFVM